MQWFDLAMMLRPLELVLMVLILLGIFAWSYAPKRRAEFEERGRIPLGDDPPN